MNRYFLIDPHQRTVTAGPDDHDACRCWLWDQEPQPSCLVWHTLVASFDPDDSFGLLLDDNGLGQEGQAFFRMPEFYHGVFAGRAVLVFESEHIPSLNIANVIADVTTVLQAVEFVSAGGGHGLPKGAVHEPPFLAN